MIDRRNGRSAARQVIPGDSTANTSSVRPPRAQTSEWTVFVDVDDVHSETRRRAPRESLVRRRPTEWDTEKDISESNKENIGYEVRRPKRVRRCVEPRGDNGDDSNARSAQPRESPASPTTPSPPQNKGKRKLKTPSPPQDKTAKKPKKSDVEKRPEPPTPETTSTDRVRRPLEDITHLFILDPTAHYFQPWRRASRVAMRASAVRRL